MTMTDNPKAMSDPEQGVLDIPIADGNEVVSLSSDEMDQLTVSLPELARSLEALLFVSCEPLSIKQLAKLMELGEKKIKEALELLREQYHERGIELRQIAGGWQLMTPEEFAPLVERLYRPKYQQLSASAMETLAIVAYRQPITRAEISAIRQTDSDHMVARLLEKKLICEVGRVSGAGRAILYGTSPDFLSFFGIDSIDQLPSLPQVKAEQETMPL